MAVPRPISSRMTSALGPAWLRIAAVSTISTMKVERPRARSSAAPTRLKSWSTTPISAPRRRHERPHLRQHRDQRVLPQVGGLAGHVRPGDEPQRPRPRAVGAELAVVGDEARRPTGGAPPPPPDAGRPRCGRRGRRPPPGAPSPRRAPDRRARSPRRSRPAPWRWRRSAPARSRIAARRSSKIRFSISSAWPPAFRIFVSISASARVVKRMAPAVVWRWTKSSASGGFSIRSACPAGVSMK